MKYITPEEIITYLPNEIRTNPKEDLITYIIRGYQQLEIPQDNNTEEILVQLEDSHNYVIPSHINHIYSVKLIDISESCEECSKTRVIYPDNINSTYCKDINVCGDCEFKYTINNNLIRFPFNNSSYILTASSLFSDDLRIKQDPHIIEYLKYYTMHEVILERSLTNDVSINLLDRISQQMNFLFTKAKGAATMKSISKRNINLKTTTFGIDEFNNRYTTTITTR